MATPGTFFDFSVYHIPGIILLMYLMLRPIFSGAPYVPTRRSHMKALLDMADVQPDDTVYELGCGDGYFAVMAAERGVRRVVGLDIMGSLVRIARWRARRQGVSERCTFATGDIRRAYLARASLVYVYLMTDIMEELAAGAFLTLKPGARILSSTFRIDTDRHPGFVLREHRKLGGMNAYLYERVVD